MAPASSLPGTWSPMAQATEGHPQASPQPRRSGPQQAPLRPPHSLLPAPRLLIAALLARRKPWRGALLTAAVFLQHLSATGNQERRAGEQRAESERRRAVPCSHRTPQPGLGPHRPHAAHPELGESTDIKPSPAPQTRPWGEPPGASGSGPCPKHQRVTVGRADTARGNSGDIHAALCHAELGTPPQHWRRGRDQQLSLNPGILRSWTGGGCPRRGGSR